MKLIHIIPLSSYLLLITACSALYSPIPKPTPTPFTIQSISNECPADNELTDPSIPSTVYIYPTGKHLLSDYLESIENDFSCDFNDDCIYVSIRLDYSNPPDEDKKNMIISSAELFLNGVYVQRYPPIILADDLVSQQFLDLRWYPRLSAGLHHAVLQIKTPDGKDHKFIWDFCLTED